MKRRKIVFRETALSDLEGIWLYTLDTWSLEQADRYYDLIIREVEFLAKKPGSGRSLNTVKPEYYSSKVKSHIIFYTYTDTEMDVVRILHESLDLPNHL